MDPGFIPMLFLLISWPTSYAISAAEEATYTKQEAIAVDQLRNSIKNELYEDYMERDEYLITWLRARNLDVGQAKEMLLKNLKWRRDEKIDDIGSEKFPQFETTIIDIESTDKIGRPLLLVPFSTWDVRKFVLSGQLPQLLRYMNKVVFEVPSQRARQAGRVHGTNSTQYFIITDLAGYNLRQHACVQCVQIFFHYIQTYERYYPQAVRETIFLNTPRLFDSIVTLTKSLWSSHLTDHVIFLGYDKKSWGSVLGKFISADQLPIQFGGTNSRKLVKLT